MRDTLLPKIPFVTLTIMKHKDEDEIPDLIKDKEAHFCYNLNQDTYRKLNMDKYEMITDMKEFTLNRGIKSLLKT